MSTPYYQFRDERLATWANTFIETVTPAPVTFHAAADVAECG